MKKEEVDLIEQLIEAKAYKSPTPPWIVGGFGDENKTDEEIAREFIDRRKRFEKKKEKSDNQNAAKIAKIKKRLAEL